MSVLDDARALDGAGPVCDACLGRVFADRSFGLTNAERGRSLRVAAALADDEPFEPVTEECWVCEGECARFDAWAERAVNAVEGVEFETYQVGTRTPPLVEENELLLREEAGLAADAGELFKSEFNREVGKRVGRLTETEVEFGRPDVQFLLDIEEGRVEATVNSAFVYGRYRKLERDIPQTEWPCGRCDGRGVLGESRECPQCDGTGYLYQASVEGLVAPPIREAMEGSEATFHGAGREDVDARMLGTGRPFVVEVREPKRRTVNVEPLERVVNDHAEGRVEVEGLRLATYEMVERVKELDASKRYRAEVEFDSSISQDALRAALSDLEGAIIEQYTPQRVDHRRANLTRTREVYEAAGEWEDETHATVEFHGQGGLYIKELVSGDDGRTEPSLAGLLGVGAEVTALDVVGVYGESEAFEDEAYFRDERRTDADEAEPEAVAETDE
ncbi:tRNA pseudouridine(54/55) synthase Pus10 [Salinigranum rubrum]|uniref:tRNA pseudouridine synthase Pus10 n=1 Tax=Salinigranum rubrum TaxID=755307 RepID=A0A2I8VEG1_9EURY|nr:tRNA pseudouridine(54/55) synthase Pus10 [Salinigranum rubrum]AUV80323.1 tRNA pseudouridine(54/55) synthase Pus10 [Salinigranum rubrum]